MAKKGPSEDKTPKQVAGNNPADAERNTEIAALKAEIAEAEAAVRQGKEAQAALKEKRKVLADKIKRDAELDLKEAEEARQRFELAQQRAATNADAAKAIYAKQKAEDREGGFSGLKVALIAGTALLAGAVLNAPIKGHQSIAGCAAEALNNGNNDASEPNSHDSTPVTLPEGSTTNSELPPSEESPEEARPNLRQRIMLTIEGLQEERERERQEREAAEQLDPILE